MKKEGPNRQRFLYRSVLSLVLAVLTVGLLSGCSTLGTLLQKEPAATDAWVGETNGNNGAAQPGGTDGRTVTLYFADSTGKYLVKEERTIPRTLSLARETVNQWLKGPATKNSGVQPAVAPTVALLDIAIKDNVATIDLSKEFLQPYGKVAPEVAVYGLANTVTQFPTVKEVRLRIEGKNVTKVGNVDVSHLTYKGSLVKEEPAKVSTGNTALPSSPSSINLFSFPPASI